MSEKWQQGRLIRRYKRFLADITTADGGMLTIHCPNTGSMRHCIQPEAPCWYSTSVSKTRKYPHTWEVATTPSGHLAGINTHRANALVKAALERDAIAELRHYPQHKSEVKYGQERSRIDFLLSGAGVDCYVEVKSVTLMEAPGQGMFPDAVSQRGSRHLRELMGIAAAGQRAVLLFCVQHTGVEWVEPAAHLDPVYAQTLTEAVAAGVEVIAYRTHIDPSKSHISLTDPLPVKL